MSAIYADYGREQRTAGGFIVAVISILSAVLVIAGLGYAVGTGGRHKAALAAAGCEPNLSPSGLQCTTVAMLVGQYVKITTPATQELSTDKAAYTAAERHRLGAAEAALAAEVTTENSLTASLARFPFPPSVAPAARRLIQANGVRASLTAEQARSSSLSQMRSFNGRVKSASTAVQADMTLLRTALDARPTANQEP
jgi:hypothetical protein